MIAASTVGSLAIHDDRAPPPAIVLVPAQEWVVLFLWPLALAYLFPDGRLPSPRWRSGRAGARVGRRNVGALPLQPTLEGPGGKVRNP